MKVDGMQSGQPSHSISSDAMGVFWRLSFLFVVAMVLIWAACDGRTRTLLFHTLLLAAGAISISLPCGLFFAACLSRTDVSGKRPAVLCLAVLLMVPLYLQTAAWDAGFGQQGWFQMISRQFAAPPLLAGWRGAIWIHAVAAIPSVTFLLMLGFRGMVPTWEEAASLDGNSVQVFTQVTLPQLVGPLLVAAIWVAVITSGEITVTDVYQIRTLAEETYVGFAMDGANPGDPLVAADIGPWLGALLTACLVLGSLTVCCWAWPIERPPTVEELRLVRLGNWRWPVTLLMGLLLIGLVGVPLGNLIGKLGVIVQQVGEIRVRTWSLTKSISLLLATPAKFREEIGWTMALSQLASLTAVMLAIPAAWAATRHRWLAWCVLLAVAVTLAMPGPTLGILIIRMFNQPGDLWEYLYDNSLAAPWLALSVKCWPFVTLVLWDVFRAVPAATLDSARLAGAGTWQQLFRIVLPQQLPALGCVWFLAVALAAGELTASILVVPPGVTTLSIRIFGLVHYGVEDRLAALCLWNVVVFVGLAGLVVILSRSWWQSRIGSC